VRTAEPGAATREDLLRIHRWMCAARALDDRMHMLVRQGRAPFVGSARGHEGIQVAATAALRADDWAVLHYRGLGNAVTRGLTAREWMLAVFARAGDPLSGGRNIPGGCFSHPRLRIAPVSQVVATWIPKAAGIAYASRLRGDGAVTLCTFGDGATSKGDFHEGLNFAAVHRLPVVFVCENNGYAISVPLRLQAGNPDLVARAAGYGMRGVAVDGTDVPACGEAAREAVARARAGEGPTLIEARIWRLNSHTSEDNQAKYRSPEELAEAARHDPIVHFEGWLIERGWLTAAAARELRDELDREASEAADWAERQPSPRPEDLERHVFAE
jgi:2-oxoisovalerate dehydrogenase E1 component alpha subunit